MASAPCSHLAEGRGPAGQPGHSALPPLAWLQSCWRPSLLGTQALGPETAGRVHAPAHCPCGPGEFLNPQ